MISPRPATTDIKPYTERHLFSMPTSCEMFLAALAAIQDYYVWTSKRGLRGEITLHSPNEVLDFLIPCFDAENRSQVVKVIRTLDGLTTDDFEQVVEFSTEVAERMSAKVEKHIAQVFGIMIGSDTPKVLPNVSSVVKPADCDIMMLPFVGADQVYEFIANNHPELSIAVPPDEGFKEEFEYGFRGRMLVGMRSGFTYLAASAGRAVVELYPSDKNRTWLSKWANPMYQMIYGMPDTIQPTLVYRAIEAVWKKVEMRQRAMQKVMV